MESNKPEPYTKIKAADSNQDIVPSPVIYISEPLLANTGELLASFSKGKGREGVVYWFGLELGRRAVITTLIVPNALTAGGCIATSEEANAEAVAAIYGTPLVILGQAHSHPGNLIRHSEIDDRDTFARFDGAISVVVPHYGRKGIDLSNCGIHRHIDGYFVFIESEYIDNHIKVLPGLRDLRRGVPKNSDIKKRSKRWFHLI